jgi:thioesterase domain-containing protein
MEIVCLQEGKGERPAFLMPNVAGSIMNYLELTKALGSGNRVYGVQCAERDQAGRFRNFHSLEEMASTIANELAARQTGMPTCLIGFSFGGALALEVAHQLSQRGHHVPLVVMIDRMPQLQLARFGLRTQANHSISRARTIASRIATKPVVWKNYFRAALLAIRQKHPFELEAWYLALTKEHQNYVRNNLANLAKYRFSGDFKNKILLLMSDMSDKAGDSVSQDSGRLHQIERSIGAKIDIVICPGDHVSMMQQPLVEHVAKELRRALEECRSRA